jgi:hypothetical protein
MPAIAIVMGLGLRYGLPLLIRSPRWRLYKGLALILCLIQLLYYYGLHLPYYQRQIFGLRRNYDVAARSLALPEGFEVIFIYQTPGQIAFINPLLNYLGSKQAFHAYQEDAFTPDDLDRSKHYVVLVGPNDRRALERMASVWYLDGPYFDSPNLPITEQYAAYHVTPWLWRDTPEPPS